MYKIWSIFNYFGYILGDQYASNLDTGTPGPGPGKGFLVSYGVAL